jgi:5-methylcytosine-specific restriction protein A
VKVGIRHRTAEATPRQRGTKWMQRRARFLYGEPLCRVCKAKGMLTEATEVDHIEPLFRGGADDEDNFQPLCAPCHKVKTAADLSRRVRVEIGLDGYPVSA